MSTDPEERTRELAAESLGAADPTGWFERLYVGAERGENVVPWDRGAPHRLLTEWALTERARPAAGRALVVGCGFGDDAELLASLGYRVTAFDVAPTGVAAATRRFPESDVDYRVADLLDLPAEFAGAFDLVLESLTVQALPVSLHAGAIAAVVGTVAPGGTLLVISAQGREGVPADGPPWPLTRAEVESFAGVLTTVRIEERSYDGSTRWRAEFRRP